MQELVDILLKYAGIPALFCAVIAVYYLVDAYRARRAGRSALFDAERQVTRDRSSKSGIAGVAMLGLTFLFFGLALIGAGSSSTPDQQPTRTLPTRTITPRAGTTPGPLASPTLMTTSSLPTVPPPPAVTNTPKPAANTPTSGRKTAVVTGTADAGGLSLRKAPSPSGELIDKLPDGTVLQLLGETKTDSGIDWSRVTDPKGREGWVAGQYLITNP